MSADENHTLRSELRHLKVLEGPLRKCDFETFPNTPQAAFEMWMREAIEAGVKEPHAMTLSTVDDQGWPDARVLILKNVDARGWHFAVKGNSPKGTQLATDPYAALTFYWPEQGRQIRIRGRAVQLPEGECRQDFLDRPLSSKIAASASQQSQVLESARQVQRAVESVRQEFEEDDDFPLPDWKVYAVDPIAVEFWQGAKDRLHQRLRYKHESAEKPWEKQLLWP